jgi:hypothetical protein
MDTLSPLPTTNCRFCSVISKANGEDPIGSATPCDQWLILEMPQPWTMEFLQNDPIVTAILQRVQALGAEGIRVRPMLIAPDKGYAKSGNRRILHYQKPAGPFATYQKQEFLVPEDQVLPLAIALLTPSAELDTFEPYRQQTQHLRDIFVCTHGNVDLACSRFGFPIYQQLRSPHPPIHPSTPLRVWRCSHFGGHRFAPTLIDLPTGQVWGHLEAEMLPALINRQGNVNELRRFYRGWSGLAKFEQIVEREIWMQRGWGWLGYAKAGETVEIADDSNGPDWADIHIHFAVPNGSETGTYAARAEVCGKVHTQSKSGTDAPDMTQKQYLVHDLRLL